MIGSNFVDVELFKINFDFRWYRALILVFIILCTSLDAHYHPKYHKCNNRNSDKKCDDHNEYIFRNIWLLAII